MRAASIPGVQHYVFDHAALPAWTGPVVRLGDLSAAERVELGDRTLARPRSVHLTWRCAARHCRQFTMHGAYKIGRCNFCHEPRPSA
jgi:hypothetical protein